MITACERTASTACHQTFQLGKSECSHSRTQYAFAALRMPVPLIFFSFSHRALAAFFFAPEHFQFCSGALLKCVGERVKITPIFQHKASICASRLRVASQPGFTIAGRGRKTQVAASPSSSHHLARYPSCGLDCENADAWCYERPILWMIVLEKRLLVDRRRMLKDAIPHTGCRRLGR